MEIVDLVGGRLVYTVDYFTSAVTSRYLESLWQEFGIPNDAMLMESGPTDLPSRTTIWLCNSVCRVLLSGATLAVSPVPLENALETQRCSNATKCQCLLNFDKLLHALA